MADANVSQSLRQLIGAALLVVSIGVPACSAVVTPAGHAVTDSKAIAPAETAQ